MHSKAPRPVAVGSRQCLIHPSRTLRLRCPDCRLEECSTARVSRVLLPNCRAACGERQQSASLRTMIENHEALCRAHRRQRNPPIAANVDRRVTPRRTTIWGPDSLKARGRAPARTIDDARLMSGATRATAYAPALSGWIEKRAPRRLGCNFSQCRHLRCRHVGMRAAGKGPALSRP
jgi:hypothetical protein